MHSITNSIPMDPFDRHLKDFFIDAEVDIDTGKIWEAVEPTLPPEPATRGPAWLRWLIGVIILLGALLWVTIMERHTAKSSEQPVIIEQKTERPGHEIVDKHTRSNPSQPSNNEEGRPAAALAAGVQRSDSETPMSRSTNRKKSDRHTPDYEGVVKGLNVTGKHLTDASIKEDHPGRKNSNLVNTGDKPATQSSNPLHPRIAAMEKNEHPSQEHPIARGATGNSPSAAAKIPVGEKKRKEHSSNMYVKPYPPISDIGRQEISPPVSNGLDLPLLPVIAPLKGVKDCYDFSLRIWRHELDIYAGPDYTPMKFTPKSSADAHYAELRDRTESALESFSLGVQYNIRHRKGFFFGVGVNYSQIDEKFELKSLQSDTMFRNGVVRIDIDSVGGKHMQTGQKRIFEVTNWDKRTYNYYRFLSIPLTIGYGFGVGRFGIEPAVGLDINLFHIKKGEILLPSGLPAYITDGHPKEVDVYRTWTGLSLTGAVKVLYPYTDRLDFFAEPYLRLPLRSMTVSSYSLDQKRDTYGLRLGVRVKL